MDAGHANLQCWALQCAEKLRIARGLAAIPGPKDVPVLGILPDIIRNMSRLFEYQVRQSSWSSMYHTWYMSHHNPKKLRGDDPEVFHPERRLEMKIRPSAYEYPVFQADPRI